MSYLVVSVICAILIVIGNDLLVLSAHRGTLCDTVLQLDYRQWLPVCAFGLAFAFIIYLPFARLLFRKMPVWISALLCGLVCVAITLFTGVSPVALQYYGWYEIKNVAIFFSAGFAFVVFAELMDR